MEVKTKGSSWYFLICSCGSPRHGATANPGNAHGMGIAGIAQRSTLLGLPRREPCPKSWMLKCVTLTLDADRATIAPTPHVDEAQFHVAGF